MAEFSNIGKHCDNPSCKQKDFLPFICSACKKTFCLEHRTFKAHNCSDVTSKEIPQCPICGQLVHIKPGEDANLKVDEHIAQGCPPSILEKTRPFTCTFHKCSKTEVIPFPCNTCRKNFCVTHRLPQDHQCARLEQQLRNQQKEKEHSSSNFFSQTFKAIQTRIDDLVKKNSNTNPTAKKVNMMKMRTKAIGKSSIPEEKRFYLEVVYPLESKVQPKLMFFDKAWSVGKVLDLAADAGNIENKNNQANADKLQLISLKNGHPLPNSLSLADCGEILQSGDSILLEKMPNSDVLKN